jgi:hypothetical protein
MLRTLEELAQDACISLAARIDGSFLGSKVYCISCSRVRRLAGSSSQLTVQGVPDFVFMYEQGNFVVLVVRQHHKRDLW